MRFLTYVKKELPLFCSSFVVSMIHINFEGVKIMNLQIKKLTDTAIVPVKAHPTDRGQSGFGSTGVRNE